MLVKEDQFNVIKNSREDVPTFMMMTILGLMVFLCMMIGFGLVNVHGSIKGMDAQAALNSLNAESPQSLRDFIRTNLLISHLSTFVIPSIVFAYFFYKSKWGSFLHINRFPKLYNLFLGIMLILLAFPIAQFAFWLNSQVPLPSTLIEMEEKTGLLVQNLLLVENPSELWFNLLVIAVVPAIGEEFIFRGIIQKKLVENMSNPHVAIWIAAFIFSAIHMQFQGFLPRIILGAVLGYLFYWTGNLWVPIFAHFINNAFQIIGQYLFQKELIEINLDDSMATVNWGLTIGSAIGVFILSRWLIQLNAKKDVD